MKRIIGYGVFLALFSYPYWPGMCMDDLRWSMMYAAAAVALLVITARGRFCWVDLVLFFLPAIAILRGAFSFVPGYTVAQAGKWIAWAAIAMAVGRVREKNTVVIFAGLVLMAILQIVLWIWPTQWELTHLSINYTHGSFRHNIRFSTVVLSGAIPVLYYLRRVETSSILKTRIIKSFLWFFVGIFSFAIYRAFSNTILACFAFSVLTLALMPSKGPRPYIEYIVFFLLVGLWALIERPDGFWFLNDRISLYKTALKLITENPAVFLFGHGPGAWFFNVMESHPHMSLLNVVYDYGIFGGIFFIGAFCLVAAMGADRRPAFIGFVLIVASTMTNSLLAYPEMMLLSAIYAGLCCQREYAPLQSQEYVSKPARWGLIIIGIVMAQQAYSKITSDYAVHTAKRVIRDPKGTWDESMRYRLLRGPGGSLEKQIYFCVAEHDYGTIHGLPDMVEEAEAKIEKIAGRSYIYYNAGPIRDLWRRWRKIKW